VALTQAAPQSLTCFEHDQSLMQGTPFSVTPDEVARLYGAVCGVSAVARRMTLWLLRQAGGKGRAEPVVSGQIPASHRAD